MTYGDDEGWFTRTVVFENGPVYSQRCPKCGRFMARATFECAINGLEEVQSKSHCKCCGDVEPVLLCWKGDCDEND